MSFDCSRFSFHQWNDFLGVIKQQGRVDLDSEWNELVAQLTRRIQAGTLDTIGRAVVPRETPDGFLITFIDDKNPKEGFKIGVGRMYVDGLLVENHGMPPYKNWEGHLAELRSNVPISFFEQPYLPFVKKADNFPEKFWRPELDDKHFLVYLDVWQREITALQMPEELIEKAVGFDTTGRLQIIWQVKILSIDEKDVTCSSKDDEIPGWNDVISPTGARLTISTGVAPMDPNPCLVPPSSGYQGLENQLYRVEIHKGGDEKSATFKWSRDNASVASRIIKIKTLTEIVVEHIKRDDLLGFKGGDWIEILDDRHELHGHPGILRRIKVDGVNESLNTLTLESALPGNHFPVDANGMPEGDWHPRIRRWDQSGVVRLEDGSTVIDLNSSGKSDGIPLPSTGGKVMLENGILVEFNLEDKDSEFKTGDYWIFAARSVDGTIEILDHSPPRGIHHHYARLAIVTPKTKHISDCRIHWPPTTEGNSCDCTVCVHPETHNDGTSTIQQAIDVINRRGGGTICLDAGTYCITEPLQLHDVKSIRIHGQGLSTLLLGGGTSTIIDIENCVGVSVQNLTVINSAFDLRRMAEAGMVRPNSLRLTSVINTKNTVDFTLDHVNAFCIASKKSTSVVLSMSGYLFGTKVRECALVAHQGIAFLSNATEINEEENNNSDKQGSRTNYLLTAGLTITDSLFLCEDMGINFDEFSFHYGNAFITNNLILGCKSTGIKLTGGAVPGSLVIVEKNALYVSGTGIQCGLDGFRILDNEITAITNPFKEEIAPSGDGIVIDGGIDPGPVSNLQIIGNRIHDRGGHGIAIRRAVGHGMIKLNMIEHVGGSGLFMDANGFTEYLSIENNHFLNIGPDNNKEEDQIYAAIWLVNILSVDFVGNVIDGVARKSSSIKRAIVGVLTMACNEQRIAGNRLQNIGNNIPKITVGIECELPFQHLSIHGNNILGIDDVESVGTWCALLVNFGLKNRNLKEPQNIKIGDRFLLWLPSLGQTIYMADSSIATTTQAFGTTGIHRNRFASRMDASPLVSITNVEACLFTENFCEIKNEQNAQLDVPLRILVNIGKPNLGAPLVEIESKKINASNNHVIRENNDFQPTLALKTEKPDKSIIVIGNLYSGQILVNNKALDPRWSNLNQTS